MHPTITVREVPDHAVALAGVKNVALRVPSGSISVSPKGKMDSPSGGGSENATAPMWASSLNLINNVVGAGLFSMPWAVKRSSVLGGILVCTFTCILNSMCYYLLAECCEQAHSFTYLGIGKKAFGEGFGTVAQVCVLMYSLGSCVSFVILVGDFLGGETGALRVDRDIVICTTSLFVFLPLSLLRNTEGLKWTSLVSFLACFGSALLVITTAVTRPTDAFPSATVRDKAYDTVQYVAITSQAWAAVPVVNVAFTAHYNAPRFYQELSNRSLSRFGLVVGFAMIFSLSIYLFVGVCGYLTFGEYTKGSILLNFSPDWSVAVQARVLLALVVAFTFPLAHHSARESIFSLASSGTVTTNTAPRNTLILTTLGLVFATTVMGVTFDKIERILAYKGAIFGTCVVYIFPPIMYAQLMRNAKMEGEEAENSPRALHLRGLLSHMKGYALIPLWGMGTCMLSLHSIMTSHS